MPRFIRKSGALSALLLALTWSVLVPAAMASSATSAAPQAAAGWPKCQGTTLTHCTTSFCGAYGSWTTKYWTVWKTILDHEVVGPPNSCSNA
jgi:hypothetical protein